MKKIKKVVIVVTKVSVMQNNMRIRKYRVWDKKLKLMLKPEDNWGLTSTGKYVYADFSYEIEENNNHIFLDYINLKDRHGKEIYEHDLITLYPGGQVRLVIWQDQYSGWVAQKKMEDGSKHVVFFYNQKEKNNTIDVVGNLYEHPELWKSS